MFSEERCPCSVSRRMTIEGEPRRFRIFEVDADGDPIKCVAENDTLREALAHRWRPNKHYKISVGRAWFNKAQFLDWAKKHQQLD
jgi:hypothetical protein